MDASAQPNPRPAKVLAVLCGGRGGRIGGGKAMIDLAGRPLASYALAAAVEAGLEAVLVAKDRTDLDLLGAQVLIEPAEPTHPLAGIVTALETFDAPIVVLPCDVPLIPPALAAALAASSEPLLIVGGPRPQPLIGRYTPALLGALREALLAEQSIGATMAELSAVELGATELASFGNPQRFLLNVNDGDDLAAAARALRC